MRAPLFSSGVSGFVTISMGVIAAYGVFALVILLLVAGGVRYAHQYVMRNLIETGELRRDVLVVQRAGAEQVYAQIMLGAGEISVGPTKPDDAGDVVMAIDHETNVVGLQPVVDYTVDDGVGFLTATLSMAMDVGIPNLRRQTEFRSHLDIRLPATTPISLTSAIGAGRGAYTLSGLDLTELRVDVGTGELTVDLRGPWPRSFAAGFDGGTGSVTLLLPEEAGVRIKANRGIGGLDVTGLQRQVGDESYWVNEAYGRTDVTLEMEANVGIGALHLIVLPLGAEIPDDEE